MMPRVVGCMVRVRRSVMRRGMRMVMRRDGGERVITAQTRIAQAARDPIAQAGPVDPIKPLGLRLRLRVAPEGRAEYREGGRAVCGGEPVAVETVG